MEAVHGKTKKWGNSLALIIPRKTVEELSLKEEQDIDILVLPKKSLAADFFGKMIFKKTTQQLKDEARKELW